MPENTLLEYTKLLLGFYGAGGDTVLGPMVLSAEQHLKNAGVKTLTEPVEPIEPVEPEDPTPEEQEEYEQQMADYEIALAQYKEDEQLFALYKIAVAARVSILHDGDPKGDKERTLTGIILQLKDYAGGEII